MRASGGVRKMSEVALFDDLHVQEKSRPYCTVKPETGIVYGTKVQSTRTVVVSDKTAKSSKQEQLRETLAKNESESESLYEGNERWARCEAKFVNSHGVLLVGTYAMVCKLVVPR